MQGMFISIILCCWTIILKSLETMMCCKVDYIAVLATMVIKVDNYVSPVLALKP